MENAFKTSEATANLSVASKHRSNLLTNQERTIRVDRRRSVPKSLTTHADSKSFQTDLSPHPSILTTEAYRDMLLHKIPDLSRLAHALSDIIQELPSSFSALNFLPALSDFNLNAFEVKTLEANTQARHVLVDNSMLKVVLIKWSGHEASNLHGHKKGGCIFKVLHGKVKEERYPNLTDNKLLSKCTFHPGNIAYIDDRMGLHLVKNPSAKIAMSMHLYTPGKEE